MLYIQKASAIRIMPVNMVAAMLGAMLIVAAVFAPWATAAALRISSE